MSILFITSPAKSMNEAEDWTSSVRPTQPRSTDKTKQLLKKLKSYSQNQLAELFSVSDALAELNHQRYQNWNDLAEKVAILLYDGDIYGMLNQQDWDRNQQKIAQKQLRIVSGLYGLLRPYDVIKPYRLEMKTSFDWLGQSLASWWSDDVTKQLNADIQKLDAEAVINLASQEYSKAVSVSDLNAPMVSIEFKEKKQGKLRTVAIYAKKARGAMIEWLVANQVTDLETIEAFTELGYQLQEKSDNEWLFVR